MFADVCRKSTDIYDSSTPPTIFSNHHFHQASSQSIVNTSASNYYALQRSIDNGSGANGDANTSNLFFDTFGETGTVNNSTGTTSFWMKQSSMIQGFSPNQMQFGANSLTGKYYVEQYILSIFRSYDTSNQKFYPVSLIFRIRAEDAGMVAFDDDKYWEVQFSFEVHDDTSIPVYQYFRLGSIKTADIYGWLQTWSHWVVVWDTNEIRMYGSAPPNIFTSHGWSNSFAGGGHGDGQWALSTSIGSKPAKFLIGTQASSNPIRFVLFNRFWWGANYDHSDILYPHYPWDNKFCFDEFSHFKNTVLTPAEIIELHNQGNTIDIAGHHTQKDNLWCWYRFGDHASDDFTAGEADGCYDASGEGNHIDIPSGFDSSVQTFISGGPST